MLFLASLGTSERFHCPMHGPHALASTVPPAFTRVCQHHRGTMEGTATIQLLTNNISVQVTIRLLYTHKCAQQWRTSE